MLARQRSTPIGFRKLWKSREDPGAPATSDPRSERPGREHPDDSSTVSVPLLTSRFQESRPSSFAPLVRNRAHDNATVAKPLVDCRDTAAMNLRDATGNVRLVAAYVVDTVQTVVRHYMDPDNEIRGKRFIGVGDRMRSAGVGSRV